MNKGAGNGVLGVCLMIGLIAGALVLGNAFKAARSDDRVVSVKGLCEREVKADNVICPFAYKEGGDNLQTLYMTIEEKNGIIIDFLKEAGISVPLFVGGATTSALHTALKIAPLYDGAVFHVKDAAQNPILAMQLAGAERERVLACLRYEQQSQGYDTNLARKY